MLIHQYRYQNWCSPIFINCKSAYFISLGRGGRGGARGGPRGGGKGKTMITVVVTCYVILSKHERLHSATVGVLMKVAQLHIIFHNC